MASCPSETPTNPWPHRLAWMLACCTFPLIWVGGLVTTYEAGMAVPDWPTTYDYWFYYPVKAWLAVWDLFLEHGHRMLAQLVGVVTVALAVVLWRVERRRWMRWLGVAAVAGVVLQGTLGGLRVIADERLLAMLHGCSAQLFFALCAALVTLTSRQWDAGRGTVPFSRSENRDSPQSENRDGARGVRRLQGLALAVTLALYVQIVLGAQLRHVTPAGGVVSFEAWVWLKLITAGLIEIGVVWLLVDARRIGRRTARGPSRLSPGENGTAPLPSTETTIARRAELLAVLFFVQLILGAATWVTNYGWPAWFTNYLWAVEYTVVAEGRLQVTLTTAHVALGALNLVTALSLALWSRRLLPTGGDA